MAAKEALNTARTVHFDGDVKAVNQCTDILADEQVAGYMEKTGFFNTKWTVSIDGNTWFYAKFVTDESINEKATQTYDSDGNLIATGTVDFNGFFESQHCYVEITAEEDSTTQMDFVDKMAILYSREAI